MTEWKTILFAPIAAALLAATGCTAISHVVGTKTEIYGNVLDQQGKPVAFCPLEGSHDSATPWLDFLTQTDRRPRDIFISDAEGNWRYAARGVRHISVEIPKDCNQRWFPGYTPGEPWDVSVDTPRVQSPYTLQVIVDTNALANPYRDYWSPINDPRGYRYKELRQQALRGYRR